MKLPSQQTSNEAERKEHVSDSFAETEDGEPREDERGNTMNLGKDIRTFFKPTANKPKKLETSPETKSVIISE